MRMRKELIWTILFVALLAVVPAKATPGLGLVGKWHFDTVTTPGDYPTSPKWTPDSSGLNNHGYLYPVGSEPILVDGKFKRALSFDGTNYVRVDHSTSMDVSGSYAFEAWVCLDDDGDYRGLFRRGALGVLASEIEIYIWPGPTLPSPYNRDRRLVVAHNRGGGASCYKYFTPFPLDQWVHLAVTWDGTTLTAYYNSIKQDPVGGTAMVNPATSDKPSIIGLGYYAAWMPGGTPFMVGLIDEVRLWDQALTADQVAASYDLRLGTEIGQEDLDGDGYPDVIFTSAFYLGRQATDWSTSITITIVPVNPSVVVGYDIDGVGGVETDEYVVINRFTPKGTNAGVSFVSSTSYSVTVTVTQGSPPCNSMHLWLYLSTGAHVGVNVQFLPYG